MNVTLDKKTIKRRNILIVCDESVKKGPHYSYFYGGALVNEQDYEKLNSFLNAEKSRVGLHEMKRTKITESNVQSYISVLNLFFDFVKCGKIRVRIMFSPNDQLIVQPKAMDESYSKFYYTFIKNAFDLFYNSFDINLRLIFDELPDKKAVNDKFKKSLIVNLKYCNKFQNKIYINRNHIEEVDSKKHPILQCIDVITGVVESELNSVAGKTPSKRKSAKHTVFEYVMSRVNEIHKNFKPMKTTQPIYSRKGYADPYKHFVYKKKAPDAPT